MNTLHLLIAIDIAFASLVWYMYKDHKAKMNALYAKYDRDYKKRRESTLDDPELVETEVIEYKKLDKNT